MSLRTRLILAFLLLSVVPLTAVTAQHYVSSLDTLHRVARRDAEQMTVELGQRMEVVKADLSERVERLWVDNRPAMQPVATVPTSGRGDRPVERVVNAAAMSGIAHALGETALLLESLEFVPAVAPVPPVSPSAATPAAPPVAPTPSASPAAPVPPVAPAAPALVVDMKLLREELEASGVEFDEWTPEVEKLVAQGLGIGSGAAAVGLKIGADALARMAESARTAAAEGKDARAAVVGALSAEAQTDEAAARRRRVETRRDTAAQQVAEARAEARARVRDVAFTRGGEGLDVTMEREGQPVGKVNATLRLNRVLGTVVSNTRRENGEIAFAVDPKGQIVADTPEDRIAVEGLGVAGSSETFISRDGWLVVMRDDPAGSGARFGIARRIGDSVRDLRVAAGRDLATGLGVIGLALIGIFPISNRLTKNLRRLHAGVDDLSRGNYAARVDVTSSDEVGRLGVAFNRMAADIEAHQKQAVERERLQRELELCRQIQHDMLPHEPFRAAFADVKGISLPAREVGGDFFNYFTMGDGDLAVLVGDVSGKGVSAALTMANVQATLKARLPVVTDLASLVDSIDGEFDRTTPRGVYATLFAAVLEPRTRALRYVNAGHHPQFVLRAGGGLDRLPSTGLPIGLLPGKGYVEQEVQLNEGDLLFFYTDGAVETENEAGEMFGAERLEALLVDLANGSDSVDTVLERAESAIRAFRGGAEPFDDATLMALRVGR